MTRIFERDLNVKVYGEYSELSVEHGDKLRLKPFSNVRECIDKEAAPFIIAKPLVESQNILKILEYFHDSKVIWMYRHYKDVASSNVNKFGEQNCIRNLEPIAEGDRDNWRSEYVPNEMIALVKNWYNHKMDPYDAAALFWLVRNSIYFSMNLDSNHRVMSVDYNEMVSNPLLTMKAIYSFAGRPAPAARIVSEVHCRSKGKGEDISISPEIEEYCTAVWNRLLSADSLMKTN